MLSMLRDPACRLVTIIGPGGVGKTRLALEAARALLTGPEHTFADGVVMISLGALPSHQPLDDLLATAIARALGFALKSVVKRANRGADRCSMLQSKPRDSWPGTPLTGVPCTGVFAT
jgi:predicted ATPase